MTNESGFAKDSNNPIHVRGNFLRFVGYSPDVKVLAGANRSLHAYLDLARRLRRFLAWKGDLYDEQH
jgi:hypothetical protein